MRVLVCGSRTWDDDTIMMMVLGHFGRGDVLIQGGAKGADAQAASIWKGLGLEVQAFPADWTRYSKGAGPIRNQQMLDEGKPEIVLAFKNEFLRDQVFETYVVKAKGGTEDMVRRARAAGIPTYIISGG